MKNIYTKFIVWIKTHQVAAVFAGVFLIIVLFFVYKTTFGGSSATSYVVGTVTKGDLVLTVNGTGQVEAENQVDLKPQGTTQSASTITAVDVKQGDTVTTNQLIAVVGNTSALTQLDQAKANVKSAQANYDKVINGATGSATDVSQTSVNTAKTNLDNVTEQQQTLVANAYRTLLNSSLTAEPVGNNAGYDAPTVSGTYTCTQEGTYDVKTYSSTGGTSVSYTGLESGSFLLTDIPRPMGTCGLFLSFDKTKVLQPEAEFNVSIPNKNSPNYNANYNAYQSALQTQAQATAPGSLEDIEIAQASLDNSKAALQSAQNTYDQSFIRAPFSGVVAAVNVSVGDVVDTSTVVASIITKQQIAKISLNEVDAAQVKIGQTATLTFSALPSVTTTGTVAQIDTIGTVTQGVVSYNAKIAFDANNQGVKPGMSVSVTIAVGKDSGVLLVPNSAVTSVGSNSNVLVLDNVTGAKDGATISLTTKPKSVSVQTGDSDNKNTVITSGLTEGELIVTHTVTGATKATSGGLLSGPGA
jgi:RND family efflux transporter MFP subunit